MLKKSDGTKAWAEAAWLAPEHYLAPMIGSPGYTLPCIQNTWHPIVAGEVLPNVTVTGGGVSQQNWLIAPSDFKAPAPLRIHISDTARHNIIVLGDGSLVYGEMHFYNSGGVVVIGADTLKPSAIYLRMWTGQQLLFWGRGSTTNGLHIQIQGEQKRIIVGEDCMFSNNGYLRNSDMHAIVDMRTGAQTNPAGHIHLEPHVWIGQDAMVLKNTHIGFGSIVGAKAIVSTDVPRYSLVAGTPAKVIRSDVSWDRWEFVRPETVAGLKVFAATLI